MSLTKNKERDKETRYEDKKCLHWFKKEESRALVGCILFIFILSISFIIVFINDDSIKTNDLHDNIFEKELNSELYKNLYPDVLDNIENYILEVKKDTIAVTIYHDKNIKYIEQQILSYLFLMRILDILISQGHNPSDEFISIFAHTERKIKIEKDNAMLDALGYAFYNPYYDIIEWRNW